MNILSSSIWKNQKFQLRALCYCIGRQPKPSRLQLSETVVHDGPSNEKYQPEGSQYFEYETERNSRQFPPGHLQSSGIDQRVGRRRWHSRLQPHRQIRSHQNVLRLRSVQRLGNNKELKTNNSNHSIEWNLIELNWVLRMKNDWVSIVKPGRARARKAFYCVMVSQKDRDANNDMLLQFHSIEQQLYNNRFENYDSRIDRIFDGLVPPYSPFGINGPQVTMQSSISLVNRWLFYFL